MVEKKIKVKKESKDKLKVKDLEKQINDYMSIAARAQADLVNYRNRVKIEMNQKEAQGKRVISLKVISLIDDFHLALDSISDKTNINQIKDVIELIKNNPDSRRMIVTAWNPSVLDEIALPSCHAFFIFNVVNGKLNCHLTQRSGDIALGIPFNLACYATLTQMIAQETNLDLGEFSHYINDAHIYENHIEGLKEQVKRKPMDLSTLHIAKKPFWDLNFEDFKLTNYSHHPIIKFPVAV